MYPVTGMYTCGSEEHLDAATFNAAQDECSESQCYDYRDYNGLEKLRYMYRSQDACVVASVRHRRQMDPESLGSQCRGFAMRGRVPPSSRSGRHGGVNRAMPRWNFCISITEKPFWEGRVACQRQTEHRSRWAEDLLYLA